MKANELMIGDWVRKLERGGHTIPVKVTGVIDDSVDFERSDGVRGVIDSIGIDPIPLTDEILQKNFPEFEQGYTIGWFPNNVGYQIEWYGDLEDNEIIMKHVGSVHQLQHILRLIGSRKEIEL